jgi:hypothetical protein
MGAFSKLVSGYSPVFVLYGCLSEFSHNAVLDVFIVSFILLTFGMKMRSLQQNHIKNLTLSTLADTLPDLQHRFCFKILVTNWA